MTEIAGQPELRDRLDALARDGARTAGRIERAAACLEDVLSEIRISAINGNVEAHRLGQQGRGFAAVVETIDRLVEKVRAAAGEVRAAAETVAEDSRQVGQLGDQVAGGISPPDLPSGSGD
jgi:methyl-accepting chemotaxis protein